MEDDYDMQEEYDVLSKKYELPTFEELAEEFDIEKLAEKESSFILREIRKTISEKTYSYLHLLENFLNPNPHPMFIFSLLKNVTPDMKERIKETYKELSKIQMKAIQLDLVYTEEGESTFIIESHKDWKKLKTEIANILETLDAKTSEQEMLKRNDYFG